MSSLPTISIVTPSYNQARFLESTIQSVLSQNYPALEYFVYDGGSSDGSAEIIRRYTEHLADWRSAPDQGQTDAIVRGWQKATGEVVAWLNSDDYFLPDTLAKVAKIFQQDVSVMVVIGACLITDENGNILGEKYARSLNLPTLLTTSGGVPGQPAVFIRRKVLKQVGYPDPTLNYVMDWEYWIRLGLYLKPQQVKVLYQPLAVVRAWPGTKTLTGVEAICEEHRRVLDKLFSSGTLSPELQALQVDSIAGTYFKQAFLEWQAGRLDDARRSLEKARLTAEPLTLWKKSLWRVRLWLPYPFYARIQMTVGRILAFWLQILQPWLKRLSAIIDSIYLSRIRMTEIANDQIIRRLFTNSSMLFGAESIATLISLIQFPLVTRLLGAEHYGAWGIVTAWVALVAQIISFRLWETIIKYLSQFIAADDKSRALAILKLCLWIDILVAVVTLVTVSLSADLAAGFVLKSRPDGVVLIRLEALNIFAGLTLSVWMAVLRVFNRFRAISVYNVISAIAIFIGWMVALHLNGGIGGLILATTLIKAGQVVALALLARRELGPYFQRPIFSAELGVLSSYRREIWVMLFSMNIDTFRKIALGNADLVMLGWLGSPAQAGVYRLAKQLAAYFNRLTNPVYDTLYPEVARLYAAEGPTPVRQLVQRLMWGFVIALSGSLAGAYLLSPIALPFIFGPDYVPALPVFFVLLLANIWVIGLWIPSVMLAGPQAKHLTVINTFSSLLMLTLMLTLTPQFGALGVAWAQVAFQVTWLVMGYPTAWRVLTTPVIQKT